MAYTNRTIRLQFDGTQVIDGLEKTDDNPDGTMHLPDLGDGIYVTVRNPMLMPPSKLVPKTDVPLDANGQPVDREAALMAGAEVMAGLVTDWRVFDPLDDADDPQPLPLPATPEAMAGLPTTISNAIGALLRKARNPR